MATLQSEFSLDDIEIVRDVIATYNCGPSRVALKAPRHLLSTPILLQASMGEKVQQLSIVPLNCNMPLKYGSGP